MPLLLKAERTLKHFKWDETVPSGIPWLFLLLTQLQLCQDAASTPIPQISKASQDMWRVGLCYTLLSANSSPIWHPYAGCEYGPRASHGPDLTRAQMEIICQNAEHIFSPETAHFFFPENLPLLLVTPWVLEGLSMSAFKELCHLYTWVCEN